MKNLLELATWLEMNEPEYLSLVVAETEDEFDAALVPLLSKAVDHLESNSRDLSELGENGLTAVLVGCLSGFGLLVTRETSSNGHVDLTITGKLCTPAQRRLGEAKLYDGYAYHIDGVAQLLGYMSGRASGYMINYVRKKRISHLIQNLRTKMDEELPMEQHGKCTDHQMKWSFCSTHSHSSGELVKLFHIGINLVPRRSPPGDG